METLRATTGNFRRLDLVTNGDYSDYNALQAQYQRRLTKGFQALLSHTFGKSLDNVSEEMQNNLQSPTGSSIPISTTRRAYSTFATHLTVQSVTRFRHYLKTVWRRNFRRFRIGCDLSCANATPVNLVSRANSLGLGVTTILRPDYVSGQPLYIEDENAPGGRRFNPLAFDRATPLAQGRQGTLGRNVLRGFPARQLDLSLHRQFNLTERLNLQLRADGFNIFNTSNFANQSGVLGAGYLTSQTFGRASRTLSSGLGGLSSIYQIGGPRSFQLSAKFNF